MHMCLENNVELVQKVVHTKIISKFICSPENLVANEFQFQKHSSSSPSWRKTLTCTQNASSRYCNQFQLFSNHSASISEFCPNKPLTTSCCSHHASYIQSSTCRTYARECIFPWQRKGPFLVLETWESRRAKIGLNVLDDLAEAMKALDGQKKNIIATALDASALWVRVTNNIPFLIVAATCLIVVQSLCTKSWRDLCSRPAVGQSILLDTEFAIVATLRSQLLNVNLICDVLISSTSYSGFWSESGTAYCLSWRHLHYCQGPFIAAIFWPLFLGRVLGAMMKQVCWHSRRSKAYQGLPEARGQSEAHGDSNLYNTMVGVP